MLLGLEEMEKVVEFFWERGAKMVAVKKGAGGATVGWDGKLVDIAPHPGPIVDTTGAGDAFCGAFAAWLAAGTEPAEAVRAGAAAGGLAVGVAGAQPSLPYAAQIEASMARLPSVQSLS